MQSAEQFLKNLLNTIFPNRAAPVLAKVLKAHEGAGKTKYSLDVRVLKVGTLEETDQVIQEVPISPIWATQKKRGVYALPSVDQVVIVEFLEWNPAFPIIAGIYGDEYETDDFKKDQFVITDGDGMKFIIDSAEKKITIDDRKKAIITLEEDKITIENDKKAMITWEDGKIIIDNGKKAIVTLEENKIIADNGMKSIVTLEANKITADNGIAQIMVNAAKISVKNKGMSLFTVLDTLITNLLTLTANISKHKTVGSPAKHLVDPNDIQLFALDIQNLTKDKLSLALILEA
jgi:phage baseplate assembly protein gpV